jgi:hypothetical protein
MFKHLWHLSSLLSNTTANNLRYTGSTKQIVFSKIQFLKRSKINCLNKSQQHKRTSNRTVQDASKVNMNCCNFFFCSFMTIQTSGSTSSSFVDRSICKRLFADSSSSSLSSLCLMLNFWASSSNLFFCISLSSSVLFSFSPLLYGPLYLFLSNFL